MAQAMEADPGQASLSAEFGEPVTHAAGRETALVVDVSGEDPLTEGRVTVHALSPGRFAGSPELHRGESQSQSPDLSCLRRTDLFTPTLPVQSSALCRASHRT